MPHSTQAHLRGILFMSAAMVCLVCNDSLVKLIGAALPLAQLVFVRGCIGVLMVWGAARTTGATTQLPRLLDRWVLARAAIDAAGTLLYLSALLHLPLANATAINLSAPLIIAVLAVLFLHERPGPGRWLAIGAGFGGVLLVVQPRSDGFDHWALVSLAGTGCHALRELLTRRIDPRVPSLLVTLSSMVAVTSLAGGVLLLQGWQPMPAGQWLPVAAAAALLSAGYVLIVNAMRHGEMSLVAPFRYVGLLAALLLGWVLWRELPNRTAVAGIALMLAAGLYLVHDGRRVRHAAPAPAVPPAAGTTGRQ